MKRCLLILLLAAGCVTQSPTNITAAKATTFGLDISSDPGTGTPHIRFGLVRWYYQSIPTSTNPIYSPVYSSSVDATIGLTTQSAKEDFRVGTLTPPLLSVPTNSPQK